MKILAIAGDAGGARALQPIIRRLQQEDGVAVECRAYKAAVKVWEAEALTTQAVLPIKIRLYDKILLGTTVGAEQNELEIIRLARDANIPTVSVLDFWTNYRARFMTAAGDFVLPTAIAVMDERARGEMIELGFPAEALRVTGQPAFDELGEYLVTNQTNSLDGSRRKIRILYVSQPLSQLYSRAELGFDEYEALKDVVAALSFVLEKYKRPAVLSLKLHPREAGRKYDLPISGKPFLEIIGADAFDNPRCAVQNSDFVIGMNSILLMEACFLGKPVISYQPNLRFPDPLPSNEHGWSKAVYRSEDLAAVLENELFDLQTRLQRKEILKAVPRKFDAAEKAAQLILKI